MNRTTQQMFGKVARDIAATERAHREDQRERERAAIEAEARLDAPLTRREVLEALDAVMEQCGGPERSMLRDLKEALS